uniref:Reverse transcriptase domain-containing protein n=1 Tax=Nothobranchius furzeri TaxID=105023 RepID=A0A8C6NRV0_NOTFU
MLNRQGLHIIHLNIRSLFPKTDLLKAWLGYNEPKIITLSETWLNDNISDNDISLDNFVLYRMDRGTRGGGVATYVSSSLQSQVIVPTVKPLHFEAIFTKISFNGNKHIIIGNIYRPPSSPRLEAIQNLLATVDSLGDSMELILLGDFNLNWLDESTLPERILLNSSNLTQLVSEPTRTCATNSSLIDWILVTHPDRFSDYGILPNCFSDHSVIFCFWKISLPHTPAKMIRLRDLHTFNTDQYLQELHSLNWNRLFLIPDVNDAWAFFHSQFMQVLDKHAPWVSVKIKGSHLPWISHDLIALFKKRDKAWKVAKLSNLHEHWTVYRKLRNFCTTQTRNAKANFYKNALHKDINNPKRFWDKIKDLRGKTNVKISHLNVNGSLINDPAEIAEAFSKHFASSPLPASAEHHGSYTLPHCCSSGFSFSEIRSEEVRKVILSLSSGNAAGPDGIESRFVRIAADVLALPLSILFNHSINSCSVPKAWKCTKIIPLHKGNDTSEPNNYRPIAIINTVVKVFEKLVFIQLSKYLEDNNLLSQYQSGFRKNFSTTTALLKFSNDIYSGFDNNLFGGAIFLDLTKAFDLVNHYLLLDKLYAFGLSRPSLLWFSSFLHHRSQFVSFNGSESNMRGVIRGVPQGSSLGPLLFSIFINDLPQCCRSCSVQLYADDTVLYCSKSSKSELQEAIQPNFDEVQLWLTQNKLLLNKSKTYSMLFHRSRTLSDSDRTLNLYFLDSSPVQPSVKMKYLGVWLEPELSFKFHIHTTCLKVTRCLRILYNSINCFEPIVRKRIVTQLLLPIIDYSDILYQNSTVSSLRSLDVVYNSLCRFILRCSFNTHHCYMYDLLGWLPLKARRQFHWLIFMFKCIYFDFPLYLKTLLVPIDSLYSTRLTTLPSFVVPRFKKEVGRLAFCVKAPQDWNKLPTELRSISTIRKFSRTVYAYVKPSCSCFV